MHILSLVTFATWSALSSHALTALMSAMAPVPQLAFALQCGALGTAVGSVVALRAKRRWADADTWTITTAWATLGLILGLLISLLAAVV